MKERQKKGDRLDVILVNRGLAPSRDKARRLILAGQVIVGEERVDRPASPTAPDAPIRLKQPPHPYVSRGGVKLAGALDAFGIDPSDITAADFGSSTGGFTDCLLQRGARHVYALDVGKGQLSFRLRQDPRVTVMEGVNVRYLRGEDLPEAVDLVTMDLSFISSLLVLPSAKSVLLKEGSILTLVKPQFEIGRERVGKGGIVRDPKDHREVLQTFVRGALEQGFRACGVTPSPIRGAEGNLEFWLHLHQDGDCLEDAELDQAVSRAHALPKETKKD